MGSITLPDGITYYADEFESVEPLSLDGTAFDGNYWEAPAYLLTFHKWADVTVEADDLSSEALNGLHDLIYCY